MGLTTKKKVISLSAVFLTATLLFGGTFAWQSISQEALNEIKGGINPGGRLHDDFNNVTYEPDATGNLPTTMTYNKDVYVENFTSTMDGVAVYARVRLDEYMEIGYAAGDQKGSQATPLITGAKLTDRTTWHTYIYGEDALTNPIRNYWTWSFGGSTTYMPTFNKNKDSLAADINGTSAASFLDYVNYADSAKATKKGFAIYDKDADDIDELTQGSVDLNALINGTLALPTQYEENVRLTEETHTATKTAAAQVISMAEYQVKLANQDFEGTGDFWVYDIDGWAYWASPIQPGTATGLLLDQISHTGIVIEDPEWYYAINVVAQFVTRNDLGQENGTGFYDSTKWTSTAKAPTDAALELLSIIGAVTDIATPIEDGEKTEVDSAAALTEAIEKGSKVTLSGSFALPQTVLAGKGAVLDLNGQSIAAEPGFLGSSLFAATGGAGLDITGNGGMIAPANGYVASVSDNAMVYIMNGSYTGGAGIFYVDQGDVVIFDGVFDGPLVEWNALNHANRLARVTVYGGIFYGTDPADVNGESLLAEGYTTQEMTIGDRTAYVVVFQTEPEETPDGGETDGDSAESDGIESGAPESSAPVESPEASAPVENPDESGADKDNASAETPAAPKPSDAGSESSAPVGDADSGDAAPGPSKDGPLESTGITGAATSGNTSQAGATSGLSGKGESGG